MSDNKNSFRDMILIIFVVLVCFGITIYGIAYLTGKVFSESTDVEVADNDMPKEVSTNPQDGDTLTFTTMQEQGEEVAPDMDNIITTVTPPVNNMENIETEQTADNIVVQDDTTESVQQAASPKKEEVKQAAVVQEVKEPAKKQEGVKEAAKKEPVKQAEPKKQAETKKQEVKKEEPKKAAQQAPAKSGVKPVAPKPVGNFVVQIAAVQSKESAEKEVAKYRAKFPDVFIKQVQISGKTWYRVRLGVSDTRQEAEQKAKRVEQEFKIKPIVTKNN